MEDKNSEIVQIRSKFETTWPKIKLALRDIDPRMSELDFQYMKALAIKMMQSSKDKISSEKWRMALDSLDDAKTDLRASKLLYNNGILNRSVNSLQQSAEKACKSLGLVLGILKTGRQIHHRSPLVFIRMLKEPIAKDMFPLFRKFGLKEEKKNIANLEKLVLSNGSEFTLLGEEQLKTCLAIVDRVKDELIPKYQAELKKIQRIFIKHLPKYKKEIMNCDVGDYIVFTIVLYIVGALSFSHEQSSRYSDMQIMRAKNYTIDTPIVKIMPKMQDIMDDALELLEKYIRRIGS